MMARSMTWTDLTWLGWERWMQARKQVCRNVTARRAAMGETKQSARGKHWTNWQEKLAAKAIKKHHGCSFLHPPKLHPDLPSTRRVHPTGVMAVDEDHASIHKAFARPTSSDGFQAQDLRRWPTPRTRHLPVPIGDPHVRARSQLHVPTQT
ncbi:uncharacterized protein BKA78DRAFT_143712 [Phyllosticta capitalensis]|uniref:uncharacterized protein n=1 Tax=Phyllosticta capitalensis TaxID=121624 RepID=UPI00312DB2E5